MKKLEVVLEGEHVAFVEGLLKDAGLTGYTMVRDVAGMGHHGPHAGRLTYNDLGSYVMIIAVGPETQIAPILEGLAPFLREHSGVAFLSDVGVMRAEYFTAA
jgi:nitrogen regulatory protein PII